jgi:hypothetical protein
MVTDWGHSQSHSNEQSLHALPPKIPLKSSLSLASLAREGKGKDAMREEFVGLVEKAVGIAR